MVATYFQTAEMDFRILELYRTFNSCDMAIIKFSKREYSFRLGWYLSYIDQLERSGKVSGKIHSNKLKTDPEYRLMHSKKTSEMHKKIKFNYNTFQGKTHSEETKLKMSNNRKNKGLGNQNWKFRKNVKNKI